MPKVACTLCGVYRREDRGKETEKSRRPERTRQESGPSLFYTLCASRAFAKFCSIFKRFNYFRNNNFPPIITRLNNALLQPRVLVFLLPPDMQYHITVNNTINSPLFFLTFVFQRTHIHGNYFYNCIGKKQPSALSET